MQYYKLFAVTTLLMLIPAVHAGQAVLRIDSYIYKEAAADTGVAATLKSGTVVDIIQRKNAWYLVSYGSGLQGWLPLHSLQLTVSREFANYIEQLPKPAKTVEREEVDPMFSEAGDEPDAPVTGVRALSSENIANVKPDVEAVKALERFAVNKEQASDFASELGLKARELEYLVNAEEEKNTTPIKEATEENN